MCRSVSILPTDLACLWFEWLQVTLESAPSVESGAVASPDYHENTQIFICGSKSAAASSSSTLAAPSVISVSYQSQEVTNGRRLALLGYWLKQSRLTTLIVIMLYWRDLHVQRVTYSTFTKDGDSEVRL